MKGKKGAKKRNEDQTMKKDVHVYVCNHCNVYSTVRAPVFQHLRALRKAHGSLLSG